MRWCLNGTSNAITFLMSLHFIDSVCITCDAFVCCRPVQEKKQKPKIRHDEFISPGPTVKNTKKYTKVIIQEKHDILYFQTGVMQMLRTTAAVQRTKARLTTFSSVYLQQFSRKKILTGAHISNTATAWQRLSFRWHSLKMHLCTTMWGTPRDGQDLTDTIFTSWQVHVQYQEKRRESVQGASINHAQRAAVVCMQDNYISSYQRCRNPNATFHSLQKTGKYLNKNLGCKDSTSTAHRDNKLYSQYCEYIQIQ